MKEIENLSLGDVLNFNKMITPLIIKILFWIGIGISVLVGLITLISGLTATIGGGFQVILGLIILIIGPLTARVYCELLIVIFKIHESLIDMNKKL